MQNLDDSLSMYYALRQQKTAEISARIGQIQLQLATELQGLQELEQQLLSAQESVLEQIRLVLETDARSLVSTSQFQEFVRDLLKEVKVKPKQACFVLEVAPKTTKWILHTLEQPLQLNQIEVFERTNSYDAGKQSLTRYCIHMVIQLGEWRQAFDIPNATAQNNDPDMYHACSAFTIWYECDIGIRTAVKQLPVATAKQQRLAQELTCVMAYVCDLFNLYSIAERVGFSHELRI
ncbi:MAG: hypothetical protein HY785_22750 [Oscillatoriophycideae cyanobacterium NC_groundwater_1537_Pr4_S-0.65um_50_18]|nr:hypothetical protein [Oscillatoriophycideae cyanobacterium NC_groundwater_1537_Pr4_S-0.65um_50_18]